MSPKPPAKIEETAPSHFPVKGSFQTKPRALLEHKLALPELELSGESPQTKFARGINVESGKRRTDNAIIAAAALAAAADIPLPLKISTTNAPGGSKFPKQALPPTTDTVPQLAVKLEDTEPEEDENKTDDETQLPAQNVNRHQDQIKVISATAPLETLAQAQAQASLLSSSEVQKPEDSILDEPKLKFAAPPLESYKVSPDAGTIGCICGIEEDDGFTIQCDICFRWQHCSCMGYKTNEEVPEDEYKCYFCDEAKWNKFDALQCKQATLARLELEKFNDPPEVVAPPKRKSLSSGNDEKKRRKSEKEVKVTERPPNEKKRSGAIEPPNSIPTPPVEINNKENPLLEDGVTAEAYQSIYYRLSENDYKTPEVCAYFSQAVLIVEKAPTDMKNCEILLQAQWKLTKFSKVIFPSHQKYLQDRNEFRRSKGHNNTAVRVRLYSDNPKQKFNGISKLGLFISDSNTNPGEEVNIPSNTAVIEFLGELDLFELHVANKVNQYSLWRTTKPRVAKVQVPNATGGCSSFVLDSRFVGNEARFIRRSCPSTANCEIKTVFVPQLQKLKFIVVTNKPITLNAEKVDEELRLAWDWDAAYPITQMMKKTVEGTYEEGKKFDDFTDEEKAELVSGVDTLLNFVECACNTSTSTQHCSIFKVKKATSYLLRSTRKASSLTNTPVSKSKDELVIPKRDKHYISWNERLARRNYEIQMSVFTVEGLGLTDEPLEPTSETAETSLVLQEENQNGHPDQKLHEGKIALSFKQQLLTNSKHNGIGKFRIVSGQDLLEPTKKTIAKSLGVPLIPEALAEIKIKVDEAFKPLIEETQAPVIALIPKMPLNEKTASALPTKMEPKSPAAGLAAAPAEAKPAVVKKLSFADYKKKMR